MSDLIRQEIAIEAEPEAIFRELLIWGQSSWWPRSSLMRFKNLSGKIDTQTLYLQKVKFPFAPSWHTKNTEVSESKFYIKRCFLDGMFKGFEELLISEYSQRSKKVAYCFNYEVNGFINKIMWKTVFKRLHINNINLVLGSLKKFLEKI
ncbi:MAG: hypothetical protein NG737_06035 [Omnitrophica bacterium]|nr:hypothetical protein [Candidatus Omnitrophota bacterium]